MNTPVNQVFLDDRGLKRWNKINELHNLGMTYDQIAKIIGLSSGNAVSVWINRNKDKFNLITNDNAPSKNDNVPSKTKDLKTKKSKKKGFDRSILDYDYFINKLSNNDNLPYADMVLDRCEGSIKRDRSLVRSVLHLIKILGSDNK